MALIKLTSVSKRYQMGENKVDALLDVELIIDKGEFIAVWGPSGSGKTTLLNLLGAIDEPTKGEVSLKGQNLAQLSDRQRSELRSSSIGFVFQNFNLIPVLTALENVMLPLQIQGENSLEAKRKARNWLAKVELSRVEDHRPDKMSGGQQQRVAIARALVTQPDWVVADEPTANLDSLTAQAIIDIMRQLNETEQTTFIFSTHDHRLLDRVSRRVNLHDGRINPIKNKN
jgi:putative ABC transport system ATP-binding protein